MATGRVDDTGALGWLKTEIRVGGATLPKWANAKARCRHTILCLGELEKDCALAPSVMCRDGDGLFYWFDLIDIICALSHSEAVPSEITHTLDLMVQNMMQTIAISSYV